MPSIDLDNWINSLLDFTDIAAVKINNIRQKPMILLGIGKAGNEVVNQISKKLVNHWGQDWRLQTPWIYLLNIYIQDVDSPSESGLDQEGCPFITINIGPKSRANLMSQSDLLDQRMVNKPGRALGRLAILYDLSVGSELRSILQKAIGSVNHGNQNIDLIVVCDAGSDASSAIYQSVEIIKKLQNSHLPNIAIETTLCPLIASFGGSNQFVENDNYCCVLAFFREIQRFQEKGKDLDSNMPVFDRILLFGEAISGDNDSSSVGNTFSFLLNEDITKEIYRAGSLRKDNPHKNSTISIIDSYSYVAPYREMRDLLAYQIIHQWLFDEKSGIICGESDPIIISDITEEFFHFLNLGKDSAANLNHDVIIDKLSAYIEKLLNNDSLISLRNIKLFLIELKKHLPSWNNQVDQFIHAVDKWLISGGCSEKAPSSGISGLSITANKRRYSSLFENIGSLALTGNDQFSIKQDTPSNESLFSTYQFEMAKVENSYLKTSSTEYVLWNVSDKSRLFQELTTSINQLRRLIYWNVYKKNGRILIGIIIAPDHPDDNDKEYVRLKVRDLIKDFPDHYTLSDDKAKEIVHRLYLLSYIFTRDIENIDIYSLIKQDQSELAKSYKAKENSWVYTQPYSKDRYPVERENHYYFLLPGIQNQRANNFQNALREYFDHNSPSFVTTKNTDKLSLVRVCHNLPVFACNFYLQASKKYKPDPSLYAFEEERSVVKWESDALSFLKQEINTADKNNNNFPKFFSSNWVNLIHQYPEECQLLGKATICNLTSFENSKNEFKFDDSFFCNSLGINGMHFREAVRQVHDIDQALTLELISEIEKITPKDIFEKFAFEQEKKEKLIIPLIQSNILEKQSAGLLFSAIMFAEMR